MTSTTLAALVTGGTVPAHTLAVLVAVALLAGWVDAVVGGGGLIQMPSLVIGLPSEVSVATVAGTNKVASMAGTGAAVVTYLRRIRLHAPAVICLVSGAAVGSAVGARLVSHLPKALLTPLTLVVVVVVGAITWARPTMGLHARPRAHDRAQAVRLAAVGLGVGLYDGAIGPGTGTFFVMALVAVAGHDFLTATALAKVANLATNIAAVTVFAWQGSVWWQVGLPMAGANLLGGLLGARTALRRGAGFVRVVFLVTVSILAVKLGVDTVRML